MLSTYTHTHTHTQGRIVRLSGLMPANWDSGPKLGWQGTQMSRSTLQPGGFIKPATSVLSYPSCPFKYDLHTHTHTYNLFLFALSLSHTHTPLLSLSLKHTHTLTHVHSSTSTFTNTHDEAEARGCCWCPSEGGGTVRPERLP